MYVCHYSYSLVNLYPPPCKSKLQSPQNPNQGGVCQVSIYKRVLTISFEFSTLSLSHYCNHYWLQTPGPHRFDAKMQNYFFWRGRTILTRWILWSYWTHLLNIQKISIMIKVSSFTCTLHILRPSHISCLHCFRRWIEHLSCRPSTLLAGKFPLHPIYTPPHPPVRFRMDFLEMSVVDKSVLFCPHPSYMCVLSLWSPTQTTKWTAGLCIRNTSSNIRIVWCICICVHIPPDMCRRMYVFVRMQWHDPKIEKLCFWHAFKWDSYLLVSHGFLLLNSSSKLTSCHHVAIQWLKLIIDGISYKYEGVLLDDI